MAWLTSWGGFPCEVSNALDVGSTPEVLTPYGLDLTLDQTPGLPTLIALPVGTRAVRLWTPEERLRVALDAVPAPTGMSTGPTVAASVFTLGDTILPSQWYLYVIPDDTLAHTLQLMSVRGSYVQVTVIALVAV
jgi:hypothetical protein